MALELARAGFKVVVLEKGSWYKREDFVHDEILNSRRNFFMPMPWDEPHLWRTGADQPYSRTNEAWTANCVGGGVIINGNANVPVQLRVAELSNVFLPMVRR